MVEETDTQGSRELEGRIAALSDVQVEKTVVALAATLHGRAREKYGDDPDLLDAVDRVARPGQRDDRLSALPPGELAGIDRRALLIGLARQDEFRGDLHRALQQGQLVAFTGFEPLIIGAVITFVLSLKFDLAVERKDGKTEVRFSFGKDATDIGFIGRLLGLGPAAAGERTAGGGDS